MPTIKQSIELVRNMGIRYVNYRIQHIFKTRSGYYTKKFPIAPEKKEYILLDNWLQSRPAFFFLSKREAEKQLPELFPQNPPLPSCFAGRIRFFNAEWKDLGTDYDWVSNPENGFKYDNSKHWSLINDYSTATGDIKFVWEKSRFSFIYEVIRYDARTGEDHSAWIWNEVQSWIKANPVNAGPNYKCSQEISLRVLAWTTALYYYSDSTSLTADLFREIQYVIYWQLKHVYDHIDFSRIAVRNNHAITESLALYIGGSIYAGFPEAAIWHKKGKAWFEEEIAYQIYQDGTFLQFSMNYHRVVVQLLSMAISFAQANGDRFSKPVYNRAYHSLQFLADCQDKTTGYLPNYGSNDGALFFPLSSCEYRDYRPQLNALHILLTGNDLYEAGTYSEEAVWWNARVNSIKEFNSLTFNKGWKLYPTGGYAILREENGFSFIRCGNHKDRPAQADNLHLDLWLNGKNFLHDSGSFKYNTSEEFISWFMGTRGHNTVMLDNHNQMLKGPRFVWFNWTQCESIETSESDEAYKFTGEIAAFGYINKKIRHKRTIVKYKNENRWVITDELINKPPGMKMVQLWHPSSQSIQISASSSDEGLPALWGKGWNSEFYGIKTESAYLQFETLNNLITTSILI
jgi:hypothetical protein